MNERPRLTIGALIFNPSKEKILLLKSPKWGGKYIFPCGHVEFGEKLVDAVKREVKEETGLLLTEIKFFKIIEFINSKEFHNKNLHFVGLQFICKSQSEEVQINDEADSYLWVKPSESLNLDLESGTSETIKSYLDK